MKKHGFKLAVVALLSLVFLFLFFRKVDWGQFLRYTTSANPFFFALIILLSPLHLATRALRWHVLLKYQKKGVRFASTFSANAVGFTVSNIFPGRVGEIVKPLYLARKEGMGPGFCLGTVVVERIFDIFTMCALLGVFLMAKPLYASAFSISPEALSRLVFWGRIGVLFALAILLVCLCLYFFKDATMRVLAFLLRPFPRGFSARVLELAREFIDGLTFFRSVGDLLLYTALSFVVWLGIVFYYWILFLAYRQPQPLFILIPYVFLTMVGASIPTPGMIGGFDFFSQLGMMSLYGIDRDLATGMTLVMHAVQIGVTCLIGYAILWKEGLSLVQLKRMGKAENP
jgi:uncharacterized protein (TIRG00374 family)